MNYQPGATTTTTSTYTSSISRLRQLDQKRKQILSHRAYIITEIKRMETELQKFIAKFESDERDTHKDIFRLEYDLVDMDKEFEETSKAWDAVGWEIEALMAEISVGKGGGRR